MATGDSAGTDVGASKRDVHGVDRWLPHSWRTTRRRRVAATIALVAFVVATSVASAQLLRLVVEELNLVAYVGLFIACWIGAGGAVVPVPGVRAVSWLMVVQQGAVLDPLVVIAVAVGAMVLGQTSYFIAATAARRRAATAGVDVIDDTDATDLADDSPQDADPGSGSNGWATRARLRVKRQVEEHGLATIFAVTALPSPFTTVATTTAAWDGMSYARFVVAATAGYLVLCTVLTLIGMGVLAGLRSLLPIP